MRYDPSIKAVFREELRNAFPIRGQMDLVAARAGLRPAWVNLSSLAPTLDNAIQDFIEWAEANKCLTKLLAAAIEENRSHDQLLRLSAQLLPLQEPLKVLDTKLGDLETILHHSLGFQDVGQWLEALGQVRRAICRVEPQPDEPPAYREGYATGFLIAQDIVITNWHVARRFWGNDGLARQVILRFGYELDAQGQTTTGTKHNLAFDWSLPHSEEEDYDFALLRLKRRAGSDRVGEGRRGFLKFLDTTSRHTQEFSGNPPLLILQHPGGDPLKLAFGPIERFDPPRHIYYRVNTKGGSSGAPCLTPKLEVIGLHHCGLNFENRGIIASAILPKIRAVLADNPQRLPEFQNVLPSIKSPAVEPASNQLRPVCLSVKKHFACRTLTGHNESVTSLALLGKDNVVSASADNTVRVWDFSDSVHSRNVIRRRDGFTTEALAVAHEANQAVSAFKDGRVVVWSYDTGTEVAQFQGDVNRVTSVGVTTRGDLVVIGSSDGRVFFWMPGIDSSLLPLGRHAGAISTVAITPNGDVAVSGSLDGSLYVWNVERRVQIASLAGHQAAVRGVDVTDDGKRAISASSDGSLRVWDLENEHCITELRGHEGKVLCVAVTADGRRAVSGGEDKTVRVWNIEVGECITVLAGHQDSISDVALTNDGERVVSGSKDATIRVWDIRDHARTSTAKVIGQGNTEPDELAMGIDAEYLADKDAGATHFIVGLATYQPGKACLPYHTHTSSEFIIVLEGVLPLLVAGRRHLLGKLDAIQFPAHRTLEDVSGNTAHFSSNPSDNIVMFLWSLNSEKLEWSFVEELLVKRFCPPSTSVHPDTRIPEAVAKHTDCTPEELLPGCVCRYYFSMSTRDTRNSGFSAGHIQLEAGRSTPRFQNDYDTCIWVLEGHIECRAGGLCAEVSQAQGFFIPGGLTFILINKHTSNAQFLWLCSGD
jgi:WD40 repeat protein